MSRADQDRGASVELAMAWEVDLDYLTQGRFAQIVLQRGLEHLAATS